MLSQTLIEYYRDPARSDANKGNSEANGNSSVEVISFH
jgi:hypothetical protein